MNRLLILALLLAAPAWAQFDPKTGRSAAGYNAVTFSATPAFDATINSTFKITLTGNVTSSTLLGGLNGQFLRFVICQDATGGRTFVWPASFQDAPTVHTAANTCEIYVFAIESGGIRYGGGSTSGGGGAVDSVFGRTGVVAAQANDYNWSQIASKPATFPPDSHGHAIADTTGLQTALDGKQASLGFTPENSANKGAASGYASLDAGTKIPAAQLPNPSATTLGGVQSKTCTGTDKVSALGTDGVLVCSADETSAGGGITTLNTLTAATQTFAIGTTGTAPNWASATSTHTLHIPMAATASVTAGLLSKSDYDAFNAKESVLTFNTGLTRTTNTITCDTASASVFGCLASADWTTFNNKQAALGFTPENSANKGAVSGYASLDAGTKIPIAQIPTGSSSTTVAIGNDARLSDARTPTAHTLTNAVHAETALTTGAVLRATGATTFGFGAVDLADTDAVTGTLADARLSANVSLLGSTIGGAELSNPAVGTKGGVEAKTCGGTDKVSAIGIDGIPVCSADQTSAGGIPAGAAVLILTGSCSTTLGAGWTEAALGGKFLLLTVAASADIGTTGGQDTVTTVLNHTHPVTDPGHAHGLQRYPTTTGGSSGFTADTSMSGTPTAVTLPMVSTTTGVTTTNPAGGAASIDNRPSFVRVILCVKD